MPHTVYMYFSRPGVLGAQCLRPLIVRRASLEGNVAGEKKMTSLFLNDHDSCPSTRSSKARTTKDGALQMVVILRGCCIMRGFYARMRSAAGPPQPVEEMRSPTREESAVVGAL